MRRTVVALAVAVVVGSAVIGLPLLLLVALMGSASTALACPAQPSAGSPLLGTELIDRLVDPPLAHPADLSEVQLENAATIVAVGEEMHIPEQGIVIALVTAAQESMFLNYANDGAGTDVAPAQRGVAGSLQFPHDAVGSDHGSVNAFQQQYPGWGTLADLMNPVVSAGKFYRALLKVPNWQTMTSAEAAQSVQRSAFPDAYAKWERLARQLYATLAGGQDEDLLAGPQLCGSGLAMSCPPSGLSVEDGLTPDALRVLRCVQQQFGDHYYAGVGKRADNPGSDHPSGRAVDVMIADYTRAAGNAHGSEVARWLTANAAGLGVKYVIFDSRIWSADRPGAGWRPHSHQAGARSKPFARAGQVHVSVYGDAAGQNVQVASAGWTLPLSPGSYTLTSGYGPRRNPTGPAGGLHTGLDFAAPEGTPVRAAAAGAVTLAGAAGGYGNLVIVKAGPVETYYAHQVAGSIHVAPGDQVEAGQVIGAVGTTGNSTGPHLHFEVRVNGRSTDPQLFLRQYGVDPGQVQRG